MFSHLHPAKFPVFIRPGMSLPDKPKKEKSTMKSKCFLLAMFFACCCPCFAGDEPPEYIDLEKVEISNQEELIKKHSFLKYIAVSHFAVINITEDGFIRGFKIKEGIVFSGKNLRDFSIWFNDGDTLHGADFSHCYIENGFVQDIFLEDCTFAGATFEGGYLNFNCSNVDFTDTYFKGTPEKECVLRIFAKDFKQTKNYKMKDIRGVKLYLCDTPGATPEDNRIDLSDFRK